MPRGDALAASCSLKEKLATAAKHAKVNAGKRSEVHPMMRSLSQVAMDAKRAAARSPGGRRHGVIPPELRMSSTKIENKEPSRKDSREEGEVGAEEQPVSCKMLVPVRDAAKIGVLQESDNGKKGVKQNMASASSEEVAEADENAAAPPLEAASPGNGEGAACPPSGHRPSHAVVLHGGPSEEVSDFNFDLHC